MSGKNILFYCQDLSKLPNLIGFAKSKNLDSDKMILVVAGADARDQAKQVQNCGVDQIVTVQTDDQFSETVSSVIAQAAEKWNVHSIIMLHQSYETEVAARVSAKLNTGCVTNCLDIVELDEGKMVVEKMLYGGVVVGRFNLTGLPLICTMSENVCREPYQGGEKTAEMIEETAEMQKVSKKILKTEPIKQSVQLQSAEKIVSFGRGVSKQEDVRLIEQLAEELNAHVGCSRPIVEDFKWMKLERQVGLTGTTVSPKLYLAIGISGQIQHVVGMKDAEVVVVINNNKSAPIFDVADYGIVGDLYEIVPRLIDSIKALKAAN